MAFCAYCGKKLEEGQVCDCAGSVAAAQTANAWQGQQNTDQQSAMNQEVAYQGNMNQQAPYQGGVNQQAPYQGGVNQQAPYQGGVNQQAPYQGNMYQQAPYQGMPNQAYGQTSEQARQAAAAASQAASQMASKAGNILSETFGHLLLIFKAPAEGGRNFIAATNVKVSCALVLIQAILAGLFALIAAGKINSLASVFSFGSSIPDVISMGKAFFITLLMSIVFALIYVLLSWGVVALSKAKTSFQQMLATAGIRASFLIPITVISMLLFLINPAVGVGVFFVGGIFLAMCVQMEALRGIQGINDNVKTYLVAVMMIIFCVLTVYLMVKIAPQTISSYYLKMMGEFDFEDVLDLFR